MTSTRRLVLLAGIVAAGAVGVGVAWKFRRAGQKPPPGFLQRPAEFIRDVDKSETVYDAASGQIKKTFMKALKERDWKAAAAAMTPEFRGKFPEPGAGKPVDNHGMIIREFGSEGLAELPSDAFLATIRRQVEEWTQVERTTWRPFEFLLAPDEQSAFLSVHFQVAGPLPDGRRVDVVGVVQAKIVKAGDTWKLAEFGWVNGTRIQGQAGPWVDITDQSGFTFNDSDANRALIAKLIDDRRTVTVGGLTVADFNKDGYWDILATQFEMKSSLFLNDGKGGFVRTPSPVADERRCPRSFLYLDLDNDGVEELVSSTVLDYDSEKASADLYVQKAGSWQLLPRALEFPIAKGTREVSTEGIVPLDVDGNGLLDLFYCCYSTRDSRQDRFNRVASYDGADNQLFMNQGGLVFREESDARGIQGTQYTFCAKTFDFDFDGDLDLLECNDYGPNVLWLNDGKGQYHEAKGHVFAEGSNYTMGVTMADWDNTGNWSVYISNMYSHAGNRIVPLAEGLSPEFRKTAGVLALGNQLYESDAKTGTWRETAIERNVNWADWAWGCLFFDADNDADKDIFVANGYTSNQDRTAPDF